MSDLHASVWQAMQSAQGGKAEILAAALASIPDGVKRQQFEDWFAIHGDAMMQKLGKVALG